MVDGELVWKTFPPAADGWRAVLELGRGDAHFMHDIRSIESAKACCFSGWLLQLLIEEGLRAYPPPAPLMSAQWLPTRQASEGMP